LQVDSAQVELEPVFVLAPLVEWLEQILQAKQVQLALPLMLLLQALPPLALLLVLPLALLLQALSPLALLLQALSPLALLMVLSLQVLLLQALPLELLLALSLQALSLQVLLLLWLMIPRLLSFFFCAFCRPFSKDLSLLQVDHTLIRGSFGRGALEESLLHQEPQH
jgi:hypothetical protein